MLRSGIDRDGILTSWVFGLRIYYSGLVRVSGSIIGLGIFYFGQVVFKVSGWNSRRTLRFRGS